jgi:hypothetical protein
MPSSQPVYGDKHALKYKKWADSALGLQFCTISAGVLFPPQVGAIGFYGLGARTRHNKRDRRKTIP